MKLPKQIQQLILEESVGQYLCDRDDDGTVMDSYAELLGASEKEGSRQASEFAPVWEPFDQRSVDEIIELIDSHCSAINTLVIEAIKIHNKNKRK